MFRRALITVATLGTLVLAGLPRANAATVTVTDCGDTTPGGGLGQLRKLINDAASGDTIIVPACTITLTGAAGEHANLTGDLDINKSLTIQGQGPASTIIDGGGTDRVFHINPANTPNVSVTLTGLTIRNGQNIGPGGGMWIMNNASVTVQDSVITGNTAGAFGAGIRVDSGPLTLIRTAVSGNTATGSNGGGGIDTSGTLTLTDSTISGNSITGGGGSNGGGIWTGQPTTITGSTISGNSAAGQTSAGGIYKTGAGAATLTNTTISGNSAPGLSPTAGGILSAGGGLVTLVNSTVTGNTAANDGGLVVNSSGGFRLKNTILASNTPQNCSVLGGGTIASHEPNLDSGNSCGFNAAAGDLINTDPQLGPLQKNGGPTQTHAPLAGSPVIDAGNNAGCPATDQRGVPRPLDVAHPGFSACDLGAVEVETLAFVTASVALNTATVHPGTLLQGTVTVGNTGEGRPLDVYVFLLAPAAAGPGLGCPGGDAVAFLTAGGPTVTCVSSGVTTFTPLFGNVTLAGGVFTPLSVPILSLAWPAGAPTGSWLAGIALTPVGAFADGRVNPLASIVLATAAFAAAP